MHTCNRSIEHVNYFINNDRRKTLQVNFRMMGRQIYDNYCFQIPIWHRRDEARGEMGGGEGLKPCPRYK
jgi:hypothetical protein